MLLYVGITLWIFFILLIGLRSDATEAAYYWPDQPKRLIAKSNKRISTFLTMTTFLFLWFLTAFRSSNIGNDTSTYIYYFNIFSKGIDKSRTFEVGYQYLNYFIGKITNDPHIFIIIIASIMYGGIIYYIYKYSKNSAISLCLFFGYFFSIFTSIFRQGIAMIIVLYGYQKLKEGKKITAALLFIIAMSFHTTAIISFLLFLNIDILKKKWIVLSLTLLCGLISSTGLFNTLFSGFLPRYTHYFESRYTATGWISVSYSLIIYIIWYMLISKSINKNNQEDRLVNINFILLLLFASFGYSVNLFTRAGEYFLLIAIVEIPNILYRGKVKYYRFWLFGLCTILLIMFIITLIYRPNWNHLYPYEFWS